MSEQAITLGLGASEFVSPGNESQLKRIQRPERTEISLLEVSTLTLWLTAAGIGLAGLALPYTRPHPATAVEPITAEILKVELETAAVAAATQSTDAAANGSSEALPAPPEVQAQPATASPAPALIEVAEPGPAIAFPVLVQQRVTTVTAQQGAIGESNNNPAQQGTVAGQAATQTLTYGIGDGKQPAPEYPRVAMRQGQEGVVMVRFTVGENGRVIAADAATPCPWPLLNSAAVRAVRDTWKFRPGSVRLFQVAIRFSLGQ